MPFCLAASAVLRYVEDCMGRSKMTEMTEMTEDALYLWAL